MNKKNKVSKIIKWVVAIVLIASVALDIFAGNYLVTFAISRSTASGIAVAPTPTTSDDTKNTVDRVWKEISELTNNWVDSSAKEVVSISSSDGLNLVGDVFTTDANSHTFQEASALEQVKNTSIPIFFIHGEEDNFVNTRMVYSLYDACNSQKDLYVVEGAGHGQALYMDPDKYFTKVFGFINSL